MIESINELIDAYVRIESINDWVNADISGECMNHLIQTLKAWTNDLVNADIKRKNWWFSNWSVNDDLVIDKSAMNQLMV